jgi:hypothetical protein
MKVREVFWRWLLASLFTLYAASQFGCGGDARIDAWSDGECDVRLATNDDPRAEAARMCNDLTHRREFTEGACTIKEAEAASWFLDSDDYFVECVPVGR